MEIELKQINENLIMLSKDMELIKNVLLSEGELTDWAKEELAKAREENEDEYISLEAL